VHGEGVSPVMFESPSCNGRRDTDEKLFRPQEKTARRYRPISTKLAVVVAHDERVPYVMFEFACWTRRDIGTKNCFGLKSKVPFFTARFRSNLHWLWRMGRECHVWCFSQPATMRGQIGTKNSFGLKSKVSFVTARFRPNLHWLWRMGRECHVWCWSHPAAVWGQIGRKNIFRPKVKCPSLLPDFDQICSVCGALRGSDTWCLSHPAGMWLEIGAKNCLGHKSKLPFIPDRFRRNLQWLWRMRRVRRLMFQPPNCNSRLGRDEKLFRGQK
jgi:hypothetical protein